MSPAIRATRSACAPTYGDRGAAGATPAGRSPRPPGTTIANYTLWRTVRAGEAGHGRLVPRLRTSYGRTRTGHRPGSLAEFCSPCLEPSRSMRVGAAVTRRSRSPPPIASQRPVWRSSACSLTHATAAARQPCEPTSTPGASRSTRRGSGSPTPTRRRSRSAARRLSPRQRRAARGRAGAPLRGARRGGGIERVGIVVDGPTAVSRRCRSSGIALRRPFTATALPARATMRRSRSTPPSSPTARTRSRPRSPTPPGTRRARIRSPSRRCNGSQPNGRGASRFVKLSAWLRSKRDKPRRAAVVPYGAVRFAEGRLTDATGKPIAGAVLASQRAACSGPARAYRPTGTVTTSEDGRFAYRIARGPSRTLRFEYKAYTLDPAPVSTADRQPRRQGGHRLKLHAAPRAQRPEDPLPRPAKGGPARKGTRVTIDVLVPDARRRVPIGNVKADAKGRFRVRLPLPPHAREGPLPLPGAAHAAARLPLPGRDVAAGVGRRRALTLRPHARRTPRPRPGRTACRRSAAARRAPPPATPPASTGARRSSRRTRRPRRPRARRAGSPCSARRSG